MLCQIKPLEVVIDKENFNYDLKKLIKNQVIKPQITYISNKNR